MNKILQPVMRSEGAIVFFFFFLKGVAEDVDLIISQSVVMIDLTALSVNVFFLCSAAQ